MGAVFRSRTPSPRGKNTHTHSSLSLATESQHPQRRGDSGTFRLGHSFKSKPDQRKAPSSQRRMQGSRDVDDDAASLAQSLLGARSRLLALESRLHEARAVVDETTR